MLAGLGAVGGSIALVIAAWVGNRVATDVRRDRHAEREMGHAESILTTAYRLKDIIAAIRSPMSTGGELSESESALAENDALKFGDENAKRRLIQANVFYLRANRHKDAFQAAYDLLPVAKAFFGDEVQDALFQFIKARHEVLVAADMYGRGPYQDADFNHKLERTFWTDFPDDEIKPRLEASVETLERVLIPIIRPTSKGAE